MYIKTRIHDLLVKSKIIAKKALNNYKNIDNIILSFKNAQNITLITTSRVKEP